MSPWMIWRIIHLETFLAHEGRPRWCWRATGRRPQDLCAVAGWGFKSFAGRARRAAEVWGLPYLALEDGFLRSVALGVEGAAPLSLAIDPVGVYYDARTPSRLEQLIENWTDITAVEIAEATQLAAFMREHGLGKYNNAPPLAKDNPLGRARPLVYVVDQTAGDYSIEGGLASPQTFVDMLDAAIAENPGAEVRVRIHPDVLAGVKQGCLLDAAKARGVRFDAESISWASLAARAARVYVATSQAGFEALIQGVPVTTFGLPFYAGWGLTDDRQVCARRTARPPFEALLAAAYLRYCRYIDPLNGQLTDAMTVARHIALTRRQYALNAGATAILGAKRHKRRAIRVFLNPSQGRLDFLKTADAALAIAEAKTGRLAVWAGKEPAGLAEQAAARGLPLVRIEDGFLRSVGLGAKRVAAASMVVDTRGIYFDPRRPSDLEVLIEAGGFSPELLAEAQRLKAVLVAAKLTKYNVGRKAAVALSARPGQRRILVPGQVEDDASIRLGAPGVKTNLGLLQAVRAAAPTAFIIYKPHPDVEAGKRPGKIPRGEMKALADQVADHMAVTSLFPLIDEVQTMTSLVGFEALIRGLAVTTYGLPFYAGWGLTTDHLSLPLRRRTRRPNLDEMIAAAFLIYPRYGDPDLGLTCDVWHVVARLTGEIDSAKVPRFSRGQQIRNTARLLGRSLF